MLQDTFLSSKKNRVVLQVPERRSPVDEIILDDFSQDNGWTIVGAQVDYGNSGGMFTLTDTVATINKEFTYSTWQYSDLKIRILQIQDGVTLELSVRGTNIDAQTMAIQSESNAANSKFNESFSYSLKGIAGAEPMSDWNNSDIASKTFSIIFTITGEIGQSITLGTLLCSEPSYDIPQALPSNVTGVIGNMNFDGPSSMNVDEIKNDDPVNSSNLKEYRNLSLPFSRLVTNPEYNFDNQQITPIESSLDLRFGAYYGIRGNANKTTINGSALREKKSGFQDSTFNSILTIDGIQSSSDSLLSAWYPHKVEMSGTVPNLGTISTQDFFIDENSIGRIINLDDVTGEFFEIEVRDSTTSTTDYNSNNLKCAWDATNKVVIKNDIQFNDWNQNLFQTVIKVVALASDGTYDENTTSQIIEPSFTNGTGKYQIPSSITYIGLVIGYANREEGLEVAIDRAIRGVGIGEGSKSIVENYQTRKEYWDEMLASVPVPTEWGVSDSNIYHYESARPEKHRLLYYAAWTHLISNILAPTQETGYAFSQQSLGKPSRQCAGAAMTPPNNC